MSNKTHSIAGRLMLGFLILGAGGFAAAAVEDQIAARIQNPAEVCVMGTECAAGLVIASAGTGEPKEPKVVYDTFCVACHGTGVNKAPIFGDAETWAPHIAKGIDVLYDSAIHGFNNGAMPPKGLCTDCSEDDIRATVDYLVEAAQAPQ